MANDNRRGRRHRLDAWRGLICLSLAVGFEEDRARLGLPAAVDRLRDALAYNGLTLDSDDRLLAGVLVGNVSNVQLAKAICSPRRMGLPEAPAVH
jgi:hypothetical protein